MPLPVMLFIYVLFTVVVIFCLLFVETLVTLLLFISSFFAGRLIELCMCVCPLYGEENVYFQLRSTTKKKRSKTEKRTKKNSLFFSVALKVRMCLDRFSVYNNATAARPCGHGPVPRQWTSTSRKKTRAWKRSPAKLHFLLKWAGFLR